MKTPVMSGDNVPSRQASTASNRREKEQMCTSSSQAPPPPQLSLDNDLELNLEPDVPLPFEYHEEDNMIESDISYEEDEEDDNEEDEISDSEDTSLFPSYDMSSIIKEYDVFISFRGADTRTDFTSHLYSALDRKGIKTYIDDSLEKGDDVWLALSKAIEDSNIAIVVFSQHYANSKWCLNELVKILQCRKDKNHRQVLIPVFHNVDPSHIRWQIGSYKEAFAHHEKYLGDKDHEKISEWKDALREAANMSGWHSCSRDYKNDSQLIQKIVNDVLQKLSLRYPIELEGVGLVGIDKICEDVEYLLSESEQNQLLENVKVIGIWGMGGLGKTTIAKAVFSRLFPQYDSACFLENVRQESKRLGQTSLRNKLLFDLLKEENPNSNHGGSTFIARRLNSKKVFIVLDDVDSSYQLDDLYKEYKNAGLDSKVIITTRNRHLLSGRVDEIYDVEKLNPKESLKLFCLHAFHRGCPEEGYEDLSETTAKYAGGVPLALRVLGSNLHSQDMDFWECELKKVKNYPYDDIRNVLQVSYDGLDIPQQKIFLDIAFFFKDEDKDSVESILNACDLFATSGIKVLEDKALITISKRNRIEMHDLLQEMGLIIVRQGIEDPGRCSRLRDVDEVYNVLKNKKGSDAVEGILLDLSSIDRLLNFSADTFNMMTKLRFLKLYSPSDKRASKVDYPRVFNKISDRLRYLEWHGYSLKSLPSTFCAEMLVEIHMPQSHILELWQGVQDVVNLMVINLRECKQLKNLPDLSQASKLKLVNLTGCQSLLAVVLFCGSLETLILDGCKKLKTLQSDKHLRSLEILGINGCTGLKEFSMSLGKIKRLDLSKTGIEKLHSLLGMRLDTLILEGLRLRNLPDNISGLSCLSKLILDGSSVERLPEGIKHLLNLEFLSLKNCRKLRYLPELPPNLLELNAANCRSLVTLSTFKNFAGMMTGKDKYILFENCMKLDGHLTMEGILLTMRSAAFYNDSACIEYRRRYDEECFVYNTVKVCLPGSKVPMQFSHRTEDSSIAIPWNVYGLGGLIMCVVLPPSKELKKHHAKIWCKRYLDDGTQVGNASAWNHEALILNSDHVYIWYDTETFRCGYKYLYRYEEDVDDDYRAIERINGQQLSFKFYLDSGGEVLNIPIKECGVLPLFDTEDVRRALRELHAELGTEYDGEFTSQVRSMLGLDSKSQHREALTAVETSNAKECNDINNQEGGAWLRHCFHVGLCLGTFLLAAVAVAKSRHLR